MVNAFVITGLNVAPALKAIGRHMLKKAIDMNIPWDGEVIIKNQSGQKITITFVPRTGMNSDLHEVGRSYWCY
ncbi:hypothetical protein [Acetobacter thailandicus]|uniref:hypothetical protein n=1 Tax=Acetobacter thailandicus TaxID=1502842 RepID=UPI001BADACE5|nr:hypothetical protein [Acetobacter thailandicus]MBS0961338.1 hypothetical protein [Acetobacter thailandicus]